MADWVSGKVTKVEYWTDALFSLYVRAPVHPFTAGQFTKLGLEIDGERVQRAYSYVNAPGNPDLEFYLVTVPEGKLSPRLAALKPGDEVLEAKTPARLESQIGTLRMSVGSITPDGDGSRLTLRIQGESNDPLPAFTATVASGQITGTTHSYQEVNVQDQLISAPASTLAPSDVDIPLRLNVTPDKVGFIRVHDIQPAAAQ